MDPQTIVTIIQAIVSILMIIAILMQKQSTSLGGIFGGGGESFHTRRGMEKILFNATIILAVLFIGLGAVQIVI